MVLWYTPKQKEDAKNLKSYHNSWCYIEKPICHKRKPKQDIWLNWFQVRMTKCDILVQDVSHKIGRGFAKDFSK